MSSCMGRAGSIGLLRILAGWLKAGSPDLRAQAKAEVRERLARHEYELAPELRRELARIYARAQAALAG